MAVATAKSKKLIVPINAPGASTEQGTLSRSIRPYAGGIDLQQNQHCNNKGMGVFVGDVVGLESEYQD